MSDFVLPLRVYWEDTDASGVVYHANYLRWFERARSEWLRSLGFDQEALRSGAGIAFTLADIAVRYLKPARLDDALEVHFELTQLRRASLDFSQAVLRPADGARLTEAQGRVACVDAATFRPRPLPALRTAGSP